MAISNCSFLELPPELIVKIGNLLSCKEKIVCTKVCKYFRACMREKLSIEHVSRTLKCVYSLVSYLEPRTAAVCLRAMPSWRPAFDLLHESPFLKLGGVRYIASYLIGCAEEEPQIFQVLYDNFSAWYFRMDQHLIRMPSILQELYVQMKQGNIDKYRELEPEFRQCIRHNIVALPEAEAGVFLSTLSVLRTYSIKDFVDDILLKEGIVCIIKVIFEDIMFDGVVTDKQTIFQVCQVLRDRNDNRFLRVDEYLLRMTPTLCNFYTELCYSRNPCLYIEWTRLIKAHLMPIQKHVDLLRSVSVVCSYSQQDLFNN